MAHLARAGNAEEFYRAIHDALGVLREYTDKVLAGEYRIEDMVFTTRISREIEDYRQSNNSTAAIKQFRAEGVTLQPGQSVRYIITDHASKSYMKRVKIAELADENTQYDRVKYYEHLLRAAESILLPFGYTTSVLDGLMHRNMQADLGRWSG
jgi:DNA polymerase-2